MENMFSNNYPIIIEFVEIDCDLHSWTMASTRVVVFPVPGGPKTTYGVPGTCFAGEIKLI